MLFDFLDFRTVRELLKSIEKDDRSIYFGTMLKKNYTWIRSHILSSVRPSCTCKSQGHLVFVFKVSVTGTSKGCGRLGGPLWVRAVEEAEQKTGMMGNRI